MNNLCDYMIIQRDKSGTGTAVFRGKNKFENDALIVARAVREDDGVTVMPWTACEKSTDEWKITLTLPQGGLYRIEVKASRGEFSPCFNRYDWEPMIACASHIGVGDIFVMAGQSNMSAYGRDPAYDPPELGVHLFDNSGRWVLASHPLNCVCDPVFANNEPSAGNSPGLAFARIMKKRLGVPVGLISAALGGSSLESWNPAEDDCFLFNSLSEKVEMTGGFAGMIWAQGCNETNEEEAGTYLEKFTQTVSLWREKFGHFPIVSAQINRHAFKGGGDDRYWGLVREAQRQAGRQISDVFVVPTMDLYTGDGIHNASGPCVILGERMALAMLGGAYGQPGVSAPDIEYIKQTDEDEIFLKIGGEHCLRTMDDIASGLNIEDENGMMSCLSISLFPGGLKVKGERKIGENAVFHAYWRREEPAFFVRDVYGLPLLACYNVKIEK